jgi:hypothetical protein
MKLVPSTHTGTCQDKDGKRPQKEKDNIKVPNTMTEECLS